MSAPARPRPRPCASCPYRRDVPSGVWAREEYERLPRWDGEVGEQAAVGALATFGCHQGDGALCSGWVAHRGDPGELLALRVGVLSGGVDPVTLDYDTDVPLWPTGAAAAEHGLRDLGAPSAEAVAVMGKVGRVRAARGRPLVED